MKKIFLFLFIFFIAILTIRFLFGGSEDSWICDNNQWVKHGFPKNPSPQIGCGQKPVNK